MLQPPFGVVFDMLRRANPVQMENPDGSVIKANDEPPFSDWKGHPYELNVHYPGLCVALAEADGHGPTDIVGFGLVLDDSSQYLCLCPLGSALRAPGGHGSPGMLAWFISKLRSQKPQKGKRSASVEVRACLTRAAGKIQRHFLTQDPSVMTRARLNGMLETVGEHLTALDNVEEESEVVN